MSTVSYHPNPVIAGREDCELALTMRDLEALAAPSPSQFLITLIGRHWILRASGAPDFSAQSWQLYGVPWCERYDAAYHSRECNWKV